MKIAIRVDSSVLIGSGHLMRCLTLAGQLREQGGEVHFICRNLEGNLSHLITDRGYYLHLLPRAEKDDSLTGYAAWLTVPQLRDAEETVAVMRELEPVGRLVIDSYALDATWESVLRPYAEEMFVIDDLANRNHDCDILLDQNFYRNKEHRYDGLVPANCKMFLGPEHALLRPEFYKARETLRQ